MGHVSVDMKMKDVSYGDRFLDTNTSLWDERTFPWILIRYIRGRSDQNEVSRRSEKNRERSEWSQS
jgi:hypothetical protein